MHVYSKNRSLIGKERLLHGSELNISCRNGHSKLEKLFGYLACSFAKKSLFIYFFFSSVFSAEVKKLPDFSKEFILKVHCSDLHFPTEVYYISEFVGAYPAP